MVTEERVHDEQHCRDAAAIALSLVIQAGPNPRARLPGPEGRSASRPKRRRPWTMSVKGAAWRHPDGLKLEQDGKKVSGILATPHGDHRRGRRARGGTLTLVTPGGATQDPDMAKLKTTGR